MFDMILPTCSRDEKGAWHFALSDLGVFEPDFDETYMFTEAGILVFDMTWVNIDMDTHKGQSLT